MLRRSAYNPSLLVLIAYLGAGCESTKDSAGSVTTVLHSDHDETYGQALIGFKGSAVSGSAALTTEAGLVPAVAASASALPGNYASTAATSGAPFGGASMAASPIPSGSPAFNGAPGVAPEPSADFADGQAGDGQAGDGQAGDGQRDAREADQDAGIPVPQDAGVSAEPEALPLFPDLPEIPWPFPEAEPEPSPIPALPLEMVVDAAVADPEEQTPSQMPQQEGDATAAGSAPERAAVLENPFWDAQTQPTSTFSIDVDTGAYTLARARVQAGHRPVPESVRIEEFLNYFHFHYEQPSGQTPLSVYTELAPCPWNTDNQLLLIGIQGQEVALEQQPPANLVFLVDVSGSMSSPEKLPLAVKGLRMLANQLRAQDRVAIVTYAGRDAVVLASTPGSDKDRILTALNSLGAGGSTNGEGGIQKAYDLAFENFDPQANNRVILATDGDFNVGLSDVEALRAFIAKKRDRGVDLTVYGFGGDWDGGNYNDAVAEQLADHGDGMYFFIDSPEEARRAFTETLSGSLLTVAKDVKVQVAMNPEHVAAYRLIGYENRVLDNAAFSNDSVDAGELGAGLSVTSLYEVIPAGGSAKIPLPIAGSVPELAGANAEGNDEEELSAPSGDRLFEVRLRYKHGRSRKSELVRHMYDAQVERAEPSPKLMFAASVAELAHELRRSQYLTTADQDRVRKQLESTLPLDQQGAIAEFMQFAEQAYGRDPSSDTAISKAATSQ